VDSGLYRASSKLLWVPPGGKSVFGGQVMGQALHAAQLTVHRDSWLPISLHSYFLKRGSPNSDIIYQCRETSNLRSFDSRSVDAIQNGQIIFKMQAQFARPEESQLRHVERADGVTGMPRGVVAPDECLGMDDLLGDLMARAPAALLPLIEELRASPIEVRYAVGAPHDPLDPDPPSMPSRQLLWVRIREPITKAPGLDAACAAYISDQPLLLTALRPHRISFPSPKLGALATLDHSMWFHGPFDADDWLLYDMHAPFAGGQAGPSAGGREQGASSGRCFLNRVRQGPLLWPPLPPRHRRDLPASPALHRPSRRLVTASACNRTARRLVRPAGRAAPCQADAEKQGGALRDEGGGAARPLARGGPRLDVGR